MKDMLLARGCAFGGSGGVYSEKTNARVVTTAESTDAALLVAELPSNPLQGKVITSWVNKQDATMSTDVWE